MSSEASKKINLLDYRFSFKFLRANVKYAYKFTISMIPNKEELMFSKCDQRLLTLTPRFNNDSNCFTRAFINDWTPTNTHRNFEASYQHKPSEVSIHVARPSGKHCSVCKE